jgi:hypothetical protein
MVCPQAVVVPAKINASVKNAKNKICFFIVLKFYPLTPDPQRGTKKPGSG